MMKRCFTIGLGFTLIFILVCGGMVSSVSAEKKLKLNHSKYSLEVGKSMTLKIKSGNKASRKVKWKSSNKKIATVSQKGIVKGKKAGNAKITATVNKKTAACKVTVHTTQEQPTPTATPTATPFPTPPDVPREEGLGWRTGKVISISNSCPYVGYTGYIHISYNGSDTLASSLLISDSIVYTKNGERCSLSDLQIGDWINFDYMYPEQAVSPNTLMGITQIRILGQ